METLKYFFCFCLIIAPAIQANPASIPSIEVNAEQLQIAAGDSAFVTCSPQGNPLPSVQWRKVEGEFGAGTVTSDNTLLIGDAQDSDRGYYVCVAVLGDTEVAQKYVYVDIQNLKRSAQGSPRVTVSEKTISIPKGGSGSVECTPAGNPRPRVQWIKSNGELRAGVRAHENTLIISDAQKEDEGHYVCQGIVDGTVMITDFAAVTIENTDRSAQSNLKVIVSQPTLLIPLGGRGAVECTPEGTPLPQIQWIKSDGEFSEGITLSGNTLIISEAREEDRGHYVCQGIVDGTVLVTDYTAVEINTNSATADVEESKVSVSVERLKIPEGKSGSITCNPGGSPLPSIHWRKHEGEFSAGTSVIGNTLTISNAQESDRGYYVCVGVVSNAIVAQKFVNIDIENVEPQAQLPGYIKLIVSQRQVIIPKGGSGSIECTPEGNPLPRVQWIKSNGEFRDGIRQIGNTLIISDAREEDRGHYACQGIVAGTVMLTNYTAVDIRDEAQQATPANLRNPNVVVSQKQLSLTPGESVSIECTPEGSPLPRVQWIKSNGEFSAGVTQNGNTLTISDAQEEDEGHYVCQGIVDGTVVRSDYTAISVQNEEPPAQLPGYLKLIVSQRQVIIPKGGSGSIECTPEGNPLPRVQWIKSNGEFRDGIRQSGNTLLISNAREEDRGHYACQGIVAGTVMLTNYTAVDIRDEPQPAPPANLRSPNVVVRQKQLIISPGESVSVECTPEGSPLPRVQWMKSNGEFSAGVTQNGNWLTISYAREEDEGHYVCQGIVDGTVVVTDFTAISVQNEEPPAQLPGYLKLIVSQRQVIIPKGGSGSIECTPEGNPLPRVQWIKSNGEFRDGIRQSGNTLLISDAREEDRGHYACQGIVAGTVMLTNYTAVDIRDEPQPAPPANLRSPNVVVSQKQLIISPGESVSVECTPEGNPLPRVQWMKSNGEFSAGVTQNGNWLTISYAREEDEGHYVCQGIVDGTVVVTDFTAISVQRVTQTPSQRNLRLILSEQQMRIPEGGNGTIECTPEGEPLPRVQWIKSNGEFRNGIIQNGNTLIISDARIEDRGHYACQGIVDGTVLLTNYSAVDIERRSPPPVTSQPPQSLQSTEGNRGGNPKITVSERQPRIPLGGSAFIECTPEGNPLPRVQWIKSNGEFRNGVGQSGNTLVITDAREEDRGHYVCQAIVDGTVLMTDFSSVTIESNEGTPDQFPKPLEVVIPEGSSYIISCDFVTGDPEQEVTWTRSDRPLPQNAQVLGQQLSIQSAKKEDSGDYQCKVTASRGGLLLRVAYVRLEVLALPLVSVQPPAQTVRRGQAVTIECVVDGDMVEVTWDRVDGSFFSSRVENQGSKLYLNGIEAEDAGYYRCSARNRAGISSGLSQVIVTDVEPQAQLPGYIKLIVSQRQVIIPKRGSGSIECTPEGNPLPRVQWIKSNGEFRDGIRQIGNTLIISDAREEDRGHYACQGIVAGTVMLTNYTAVDIRDEAQQATPANIRNPNVVVSQKQLSLTPGESVSIECTPEGSPLPRVQWIKSNGEFSAGVTQNGNTLTISYAQEEDEGHYVCQGIVDGTVVRSDYTAISVQNEEPPAQLPGYLKLIVSQRQVIIPKGGSGSIECTPEGNPLPRVQWIKSNGEFRDGIRQSGNTLLISDAREEDRGHYACQGIVAGTVMLTNYTAVDIRDEPQPAPPANLRSPNVVVSQKQLIVSPGESVSVECTPEGSPLPRVQWIKSNGEFRAGVTQNGNTLTISDAREEDEGHYVCQGIVDGTVLVTDFSAIYVQNEPQPAPPANLRSPNVVVSQKQLIVSPGESVSIECTPEGNPLPRVQWMKSNGEFSAGVTQNGNWLTISYAREEDEGHYVCQGIVDGTVVVTDFTAISVQNEEPPVQLPGYLKLIVSQRQVIIPKGGSGSIECTPEGNPLPRVQWIKSNGEFRDGIRQSGNTLIISDAREEDRGHYACQGIVAGTVMLTNYTAVDIRDEPQPAPLASLRSPNVVVSQKQLIISPGESVSVECTPEGSPLPRVQWIKSNGEFSAGVTQNGNTLTISDGREEDKGHYVCQGIVDGTVVVTDYAAVNIKDESQPAPPANLRSPNVVVSQRQLSISPGETVSIDCIPEGSPLPRVQWIKSNGYFRAGIITQDDAQKEDEGYSYSNGGFRAGIITQYDAQKEDEGYSYSNGGFRAGITQYGNTLTISDARKEDEGHYECQGIVDGTVMVTDYSAISVQREERPPVVAGAGHPRVQVNVRQLRIPRGGSGTVECTPGGSPLPTIQWSKHDGEFGVGTRQSGNALIISDVQEQDGGHYVCDGMVNGTAAWTDYLAVEIESNEPISQSLSYPRVTVRVRQLKIPRGGTMAIECTPEGSPLPTVQWSKDGGNFGVGTRQSGNFLVLSDAQEDDRGNYVCSAIVDGNPVFSDYLTVEIQYICELPQETGPCRAAIRHWYYDTTQRRCQKFIWGGCGGNKNNFETEEQCSLECERMRP